MRSIRGAATMAALVAATMLGVACGGTTTAGTTCTKTYNVGLVTDVGKLSDKSFNANAWQGVQDAVADSSLCVKAKVIESNQPTDYQKNMQLFIDQNYDMVLSDWTTVGNVKLAKTRSFKLGDLEIQRLSYTDFTPNPTIANLTFGLALATASVSSPSRKPTVTTMS